VSRAIERAGADRVAWLIERAPRSRLALVARPGARRDHRLGGFGQDAVLAAERERALSDEEHVLTASEHAPSERHRVAEPGDGADRSGA